MRTVQAQSLKTLNNKSFPIFQHGLASELATSNCSNHIHTYIHSYTYITQLVLISFTTLCYNIPVQGSRVPVISTAINIGADFGGFILLHLSGQGGQGDIGQRTLSRLCIGNPNRYYNYQIFTLVITSTTTTTTTSIYQFLHYYYYYYY